MRKKMLCIFYFYFLTSFLLSAEIENFKTKIDKNNPIKYKSGIIIVFDSFIDWTNQKIYIKASQNAKPENGIELMKTYTVLKAESLNRAAIIIDNINIDSKNNIRNFRELEPSFSKKISTFIRNVTIKEQNYNSKQGIVSCAIEIPLSGKDSVMSIMVKDYIPSNFSFRLFKNIFSNILYASGNTGLIIDARNIKIDPSLLPKVLSEDNGTVYSPKELKKETLEEKGAVQYIVVGKKVDTNFIKSESLKQDIEALKRTGSNPAILSAYKSSGEIKTDVVISKKDAENIKAQPFLAEGKVTIIVSSTVGGIIGENIGDYEIKVVRLF